MNNEESLPPPTTGVYALAADRNRRQELKNAIIDGKLMEVQKTRMDLIIKYLNGGVCYVQSPDRKVWGQLTSPGFDSTSLSYRVEV